MDNGQNNPYGFIMNPDKPPKKPLGLGGANSTLTRVALAGGGLIILIILIIVGLSALNSSSNTQSQKMLELAQTQTEILRVAEATEDKTSSSDLSKLVVNLRASVNSSLKDTLAALQVRGQKVDDKKLELGLNPENDSVLTDAEQNSTFDEAYKALLTQQLDNYQILLESTHSSANEDEKPILAQAYEQAGLLKEQLSSIQ